VAERVYVGTYTRLTGQGIQVFDVDAASGSLRHRQSVAAVDPSFLALDAAGTTLFAVSEGMGSEGGAVESYAVDPDTAALMWLSRQSTGGGEPCHLCIEPSGRWLVVANHEHGSVAVFPIFADGRLGARSDLRQHVGSGPGPTQAGPHAHFVTPDPTGQRLLVCDKGIDQVLRYQVVDGRLVPDTPAAMRLHPGAAPRHLSFHPSGRYCYVNGEADMTINAFAYPDGLSEMQSLSTLPDGADREGCSTAQIMVEPSGRFVYVSNRGHDSLACFAIDADSGRLTPLGHVSTQGRTPRNFNIDPSGRRLYVANQNSDTIVTFGIDPQTGALTPTGQVVEVGAPVCILFG
jgi:6-phosphogluconolactonase